ncbi:XRE family transcriptional regulator [Kibdelosporangium philippinense]|uniref:XRE family transcriptional regulator n=1 Tax=Kibdelosporangium philippinense TaxID=211113 RepID=A0ABS8ZBE1_9PSEU|nr:XRE family transcriptional regulator [Kibdelosporangium philippinense]MCE7005174.1 XRE family transcriptional regulator [Kibdelosporangium philippinense]
MATSNTLLREVRERTPSRQHPGDCLSRQELAELVNAHLWQMHGQRVEIDAGYIGKLERGVITWPGQLYREALRSILDVTTDAQLGLRNTRRGVVPVGPSRERDLGSAAPHSVPAVVDRRHIRDVIGAARFLSDWDHMHGGWSLLDAALSQARWARQLMTADCPPALRTPLCQAVADLVGTCGFKLFDTGAYEEANRYFRFALVCTEEADDWHRRARVLARMVRLAVDSGQPDRALTLAERALVRADRLAPVRRSMVHVAHAKALAARRRPQDALRAIGAADETFTRAPDDCAPLWTDRYTAAHHAGETAETLATLQASGSEARFALARKGFGDKYPRARVLAELKFATTALETGDPAEAATIAAGALDTAEHMRSGRVEDLLRTLAAQVAKHTSREVQDLKARMEETQA